MPPSHPIPLAAGFNPAPPRTRSHAKAASTAPDSARAPSGKPGKLTCVMPHVPSQSMSDLCAVAASAHPRSDFM